MGQGKLLGKSRYTSSTPDLWLILEITLAIPMFLELTGLPSSDPVARSLTSALRRQVDALIPLQDPESGLWRTLIDDPTSYIETSGSSGFVGGILMAIRLVSFHLT